MLVDIILLILVILILYIIYINKFSKEHMLSEQQAYMYNKNESRLIGNYYNMINDTELSNEQRCHNNDKVITELQNNPSVSPKILGMAKKFKAENCKVLQQKDLENMHVLGDENTIKSDKYEYYLKDNMNNEPKLFRVNRIDKTEKPLESNASLIIKVMNNVYSFNTQNSKWYIDKNNSWNMVTDNNTLSKLNFFVNEFMVLRTQFNKNGKKLVNTIPIFHINNDLFPIKKQIQSDLYEFSIVNGKLQISNITQQKIESKDQDALVILLLNDNIYILSQSYNWMVIENNNFKIIHNNSTIDQLNNVYNSLIERKTLMNNIESPVMFNYENLYYTLSDNMPLHIKNKEPFLYTINNDTYSVIKSNKDQVNSLKLMLEFISIMIFNNMIYFKTKTGNWVTDKSKDNTIKLQPISDVNSQNIDKQLLNYMTEKLEERSTYYKAGDVNPFVYNEFKIVLQNGHCIKDIDGLLYVKFPNQEYLKFIKINQYDIVPPQKLSQIKPRLENLVKRFEKFRSLGIKVYNKGDPTPILFNNYNYKINNENTIEKNNVPFQTNLTVLLNMGNVLYAKTVDGNWYKEKNETLTPEYEKEYDTLNMYLVKAVSLRNMGMQLQTKQQVPNLQSCSKSLDCLNNNAFCRVGNNLCMYDDECNFMYREKNKDQRDELCKKMPKSIEWFTLKNDSPVLLNTIKSERVLTKLPNSLFDNKNIKVCSSNSLANTNGCVSIIGMHNVYIFLNNLKQLVTTSNDKENLPGYVIIKREGEEKYTLSVYNWPSKSPLSDVINRSEIFKSIKNKSLDNVNIETNTNEMMLFSL
jgi:hypothetical protein